MASSTAGQLLSSGMLSGPVSSSSVDDEDEIYDDEMPQSSSIGAGSAAANKRRKQTKPIRFSALASEENDRATGVDVLDLSKAPVVGGSSSATSSTSNRANNAKPQRGGTVPTPTGAAVLDLCVKTPALVGNSLKPHNDNNNIDNASRKRRLSGNNSRKVESSPCSMCQTSFANRGLLQKHMKDAHGVAIFEPVANKPTSRSRPRPKPATAPSTTTTVPNSKPIVKSETSAVATNDATNAAAAAALAQALFLPGVTCSTSSTQPTFTTSNPAFNPLMFLPNPWASVLPPDSLAKLIQAYQLGGSQALPNSASSSGASPQTSSSPGLANNPGHSGRSNPTPPSSSDRSSPMPDDAKRNFENAKVEASDWDGNEGSAAVATGLPGIGLLGFDDPSMLDQKPADSLLRSTVAARMADRVECDICHKQVCNKYFLKSHKLKIHGIVPPADISTPSSKNKSTAAALTASPSPSLSYQTNANNDVASELSSVPTSGLAEAFLSSLPGLFRSPAKAENSVETNQKIVLNGEDKSKNSNLFAGSALLRTQSPQPTNKTRTPATPSSSTACIDLSVRRTTTQSSSSGNSATGLIRPFGSPSSTGFPSQQQAFPAYLPPMPGMPPGAIPPPGWRPGSTWRWKETSSISRVTCDICGKELCNKYFLRTHKQNRHGIKDETKSSTSGSSKSNKNAANGANPDGADWVSSLPLFPGKDGESESKLDQARCRCSECGKRFLSPVVYRRHMGLCHGIPVLIGAEHEQRNRNVYLNKLKRQCRRRRQKLLASIAEGSSPHLADFGVANPDEDAVTFQIVSAIASPNDSGMAVESGSEGDAFFDWPQQLCVYLRKRQQQTPSASSTCESVENASSAGSKATLPTTVTLTLKLQEKKPGSYVAMRPFYTKSGELLAIPSSGFEMMTSSNVDQTGGNNLPSLLMPSSSTLQSMMLYSSGDEEGEVTAEQDNNSNVGSGEVADSEMAVALAATATSEEGDEESGMMIVEGGESNEETEPQQQTSEIVEQYAPVAEGSSNSEANEQQ